MRAVKSGEGVEIVDPLNCSGCGTFRPALLLCKTGIGFESSCPDCIEKRYDQGSQTIEFELEQSRSKELNPHLNGTHERVLALREKGLSFQKIAIELGKSKSVVATISGGTTTRSALASIKDRNPCDRPA